jgi:hypothetical protein
MPGDLSILIVLRLLYSSSAERGISRQPFSRGSGGYANWCHDYDINTFTSPEYLHIEGPYSVAQLAAVYTTVPAHLGRALQFQARHLEMVMAVLMGHFIYLSTLVTINGLL